MRLRSAFPRFSVSNRSKVQSRSRRWLLEALEPRLAMSASPAHAGVEQAAVMGESGAHTTALVRMAHNLADSAAAATNHGHASLRESGSAQSQGQISAQLAPSVNLSSVFKNASLGSIPFNQYFEDCSGNALAADIDYNILKGNVTGVSSGTNLIKTQGFLPSRLFLWYNARFVNQSFGGNTAGFNENIPVRMVAALNGAMTQGIASEGASSAPPFHIPRRI